jgi:hypothetical protein
MKDICHFSMRFSIYSKCREYPGSNSSVILLKIHAIDRILSFQNPNHAMDHERSCMAKTFRRLFHESFALKLADS